MEYHRAYINICCSLDFLQWQRSSSSLWEKITAHWRPVPETPSPGPSKEHTWDMSGDSQRAQSCHRQHPCEAGGRPRQVEGLHEQVVLECSQRRYNPSWFCSFREHCKGRNICFILHNNENQIVWSCPCSCTEMLYLIKKNGFQLEAGGSTFPWINLYRKCIPTFEIFSPFHKKILVLLQNFWVLILDICKGDATDEN